MEYIGVNQSGSLAKTLAVVSKYLAEGRPVQVRVADSGDNGPKAEHNGVEFEVSVDFDEHSNVDVPKPKDGVMAKMPMSEVNEMMDSIIELEEILLDMLHQHGENWALSVNQDACALLGHPFPREGDEYYPTDRCYCRARKKEVV